MSSLECSKSDNKELNISIMFALASAGIIIKIFLNNDTEDVTDNNSNTDYNGPATSTIWGYGLSAISLFTLIFVSISLATKCSVDEESLGVFFGKFFSKSLPILCLLLILVWIIILNVVYFKRINQKRVAKEYNTYSFISSVLIIIQLAVLFKAMTLEINQDKKTKGELFIKNNLPKMSYIITLFNFIFVGMMNVVLKFYSTDG